MGEPFKFDAPNYLDFGNSSNLSVDEDECDRYYSTHVEEPSAAVPSAKKQASVPKKPLKSNLRRSISASDVRTAAKKFNRPMKRSNGLLKSTSNYSSSSRLYNSQGSLNKETPAQKYVSMAEALKLFEGNYRAPPKSAPVASSSKMQPKVTVPQTPKLAAIKRHRDVNYLPQEQRELLMLEDLKKLNFKANPVKRIVLKKDNTQQKPEKKCTALKPFSFDERDKMKEKLKEEKLKQIADEEKRVREFRAKPILPGVSHNTNVKPKIYEPVKPKVLEPAKPVVPLFKAKPATVVHQKPFQPIIKEHPLLETSQFVLNTDRRAKAREDFDKRLKEMNERRALILKEWDEKVEAEEKENMKRLRQALVHKAKPFLVSKPFQPQPSNQSVTSPKSPNFTKNL